MPKSKIKVIRYLIAAAILWGGFRGPEALAQQAKRPFTVADEIGLTLFDAQGMVGEPEIRFSPDGKYVATWTEHGRLDLNCVEDSLRFYRTQDIEGFLKDGGSKPPQPAWVVTLSAKHGRVIPEWRWLKDSSGVAILRFDFTHISQQLVLADLRKKTVEPLTPPGDAILTFDVRDRQHYVYVVADHSEWSKKEEARSQAGAFVGTGVDQWVLLFPDNPVVRNWADGTYIKRLWAVVDGKRFEVKHNGAPPVFREDSAYMSLSPDGRSLAVIAPVEEVPLSWETLYPPPAHLPAVLEGGVHAVHAGHGTAEQYARIDLKSGSVQPLTGAPHIASLGMGFGVGPSWSSDGQQVLLPDTFVKSQQNAPGPPCIAIADLRSGGSRCAIAPKYGYTENTDPDRKSVV